jgi:hypothetical protein
MSFIEAVNTLASIDKVIKVGNFLTGEGACFKAMDKNKERDIGVHGEVGIINEVNAENFGIVEIVREPG